MQYDEKKDPVTKPKRAKRRTEATKVNEREEAHRKRVSTGGSDATGTARGQNGEESGANIPEFTKDIGRRT